MALRPRLSAGLPFRIRSMQSIGTLTRMGNPHSRGFAPSCAVPSEVFSACSVGDRDFKGRYAERTRTDPFRLMEVLLVERMAGDRVDTAASNTSRSCSPVATVSRAGPPGARAFGVQTRNSGRRDSKRAIAAWTCV